MMSLDFPQIDKLITLSVISATNRSPAFDCGRHQVKNWQKVKFRVDNTLFTISSENIKWEHKLNGLQMVASLLKY